MPVAAFAAVLVNVSRADERHGLLSLYFVRDLAVAIVVASAWFYLAVGVSRLWRRTKAPRRSSLGKVIHKGPALDATKRFVSSRAKPRDYNDEAVRRRSEHQMQRPALHPTRLVIARMPIATPESHG